MKNYANISYVNEAIDSLVREVRREQLEAIEEVIWRRQHMIERILLQGTPYLMQSSGARFDRMYQLRQRLWSKFNELTRVIGLFHEV
ncbi:MAG: hypothetical protein IJB59_05850 [Oscillospiraceae bacterium]|nr:hypothetical protein [Oscillospiraceae bacterium]